MDSSTVIPIFYFREDSDKNNLRLWRDQLRRAGKKLVFTNGVFDIIHAGHVTYLAQARSMGDALIVGLNADSSVRRLKGPSRPLQEEADRAAVMSALRSTDAVAIFDEDTPLHLIEWVIPDVLVKGGDWAKESIVGREIVEAHGGSVMPLPFVEGRSTTSIVERVLKRHSE